MTPPFRMVHAALMAGFLVACATEAPKPAIVQVVLTPSEATISVGQPIRLTATVQVAPTGSAYVVAWSSADTAAVSVDSTGLVLGRASSPGIAVCATVTASDDPSTMKSCSTVAVAPAPDCPGPTGSLIPSLDTLNVGAVAQFQIPPAQLSGRNPAEIRWTVDYPATATIDSLTGVVTAVSAGGTDVIATDPLASSPCPHDWHSILIVR